MKNGKCPSCGSDQITNDDLFANKNLRKQIERFKSEQQATATTSSADKQAAGGSGVTDMDWLMRCHYFTRSEPRIIKGAQWLHLVSAGKSATIWYVSTSAC